MRNGLRLSILLLSFLSFSAKSSGRNCFVEPYVGYDSQIRRMTFRGGFGDNILHHTSPQHNFYAGVRITEMLSLEAGFESTATRTRSVALTTGDVAAGTVIHEMVSPVVFKSKAKMKGPHVNLIGFIPLIDKKLHLIASVGLANYKATFERMTLQFGLNPTHPSSLARTMSKHKSVVRLMGGLQAKVSSHLSIRGSVHWVNTSKIHVDSNDARWPKTELKLKNSVVYGAGAIWAF